jgi:MoaA/NifB/PqqE/SkfB family radical SAM enzyme
MNKTLTLAKNILYSNFGKLKHPFKLTLIVTYRCFCRCQTCNIWRRRPGNEMTLEEVRRFFRTNDYFSWVNLSGGEMFMRNDITELMKTIIRESPNLYLLDFPTTGFKPEIIVKSVKELVAMGPKKLLITVSIDGPEALHDEMRGVNGLWKNAVATFQALRDIKHPALGVFAGVTVSELNYKHMNALFEQVMQHVPGVTFQDFHLNLAHDSPHYYENVGFVRKDTLKELVGVIEDFRRRRSFRPHPVNFLEHVYQKLLKQFIMTSRCPLPCAALASSCFIDAEWNLYPCATFDRQLGNLRDYDLDLMKAWNEEETRRLREEIVKGMCPQCWTPCEAYQTIFANLFRRGRQKVKA